MILPKTQKLPLDLALVALELVFHMRPRHVILAHVMRIIVIRSVNHRAAADHDLAHRHFRTRRQDMHRADRVDLVRVRRVLDRPLVKTRMHNRIGLFILEYIDEDLIRARIRQIDLVESDLRMLERRTLHIDRNQPVAPIVRNQTPQQLGADKTRRARKQNGSARRVRPLIPRRFFRSPRTRSHFPLHLNRNPKFALNILPLFNPIVKRDAPKDETTRTKKKAFLRPVAADGA